MARCSTVRCRSPWRLQKIPVRWLGAARGPAPRVAGPAPRHGARPLARFLTGRDQSGRDLPLDDPLAALLARLSPVHDPAALVRAAWRSRRCSVLTCDAMMRLEEGLTTCWRGSGVPERVLPFRADRFPDRSKRTKGRGARQDGRRSLPVEPSLTSPTTCSAAARSERRKAQTVARLLV